MERKAFNSLNEAALQVQMNEGAKGTPAGYPMRNRRVPLGTPKRTPDTPRKPQSKQMADAEARRGIHAGDPRHPDHQKNYPNHPAYAHKGDGRSPIQSHVEYDEVESMVLEYFENYFGGTLNESISDEDIMEAVYDLVDLCEAVCEEVGLDEKKLSYKEKVARVAGDASAQAAVSSQEGDPEQTDADRERIRKAKLYSRKHSKNWSAADGPEAERLTTQFMRGRDKGRK